MKLKRLYESGKVVGVKVVHAGDVQHFSESFVINARKEGWLSFNFDKIVIHGEDGSLVYKVKRKPGYYCTICREQVQNRDDAEDHAEEIHSGTVRYEVIHYFDCAREE